MGRRPLRALPLLGVAVLLVLLPRLPQSAPDAVRALGAAGYLVALIALWQNRAEPWVLVVFLGLALNSLALSLNGGRMPVSGEALSRAGSPTGFGAETLLTPRYVLAGPHTRVTALGDTLSVRIGNAGMVLSPGDVVMALGLAGFVQGRMRGATPS
ncbi:MAG: hypothetical protein E6H04_07590 [Bacillati bacterium ANGP1]|uniref:DUF5317 domain-containing protein n=1 Tax=Candidatus Segetimicrobium genomatis TaxID=2569760 RepID=A0A537JD25_9BACT|nr:MAG: hypothetical protein E6H04_07590 [Terrabacteria group bacterium ANGP1]